MNHKRAQRGAWRVRREPTLQRPRHTPDAPRYTLPLAAQILFLVLLCSFLFFYRLSDRDLWSSHEGRAAQDAQSILNNNRWGLPRLFDRKLELQKPPMYYWLVAGIARLKASQVDALAVRLPAALAALGGVLAVFCFLHSRGRPIAGVIAALILATAVHYTALARIGRIDMPLTCAVTVILCCFYSGRHATRSTVGWMWFLPAYIALAIAIFLKGPIGLVLPFAVAGGFLVMERQLPPPWHIKRWFQLMHEFGLWWGLPLVLGLSAPWFIWANVQSNGSFFATFFQHHNFDRVFGGSVGDHKLRSHEWYLYGPYLAGYFLPWSLLLPIALWHSWQQRRNAPDPEARFGMAWLLAVILVLSCVGFKRPDYLVPAFPGAAIFLGCVAEQWYQRFQFRRRLLFGFNSLLAGCLAAWFCYLHFFLPVQEPGREYRRFAAAIRRHVPPPGLVLFFRTEAHALAFHLGPEIDTFLEWENLAIWAGRPGCHYIVMPLSCAREWPEHVASGRLEEVIRSTEFAGAGQREKPLVLMRSCPYDNPPCMISRNDLP